MNSLIAWMANNRVASNLLMMVLVLGGLTSMLSMKQEVFPEFAVEAVNVTVSYPGAGPEEVEQGVLLAVEDAVSGLDQVDAVVSTASEGSGSVSVELINDADVEQAVTDVTAAVNAITTLPVDAETPKVLQASRRRQVLSVLVAGDQDLRDLQRVAQDLKDDIVASPDVSLVELSGVPANEVSVEVPASALRQYDLTLDEVASTVAAVSVERGAGTVETRDGDLSVRVSDRRDAELTISDIVLRSGVNGSTIRLGDIATVTDGFEDSDDALWVDGQRAVRLDVYRMGDETPSAVSDATREVVEATSARLGSTVDITIVQDSSEILSARLQLLLKNAFMGLLLVLGVLALFLDLRTAVWVAMGIPVSFLGAFLLLPTLGVTINMISLFAFLVVLGLVVDDAIVVGEQVFYEQEQGGRPVGAAVSGARRMLGPVVVAILTTVLAFGPMLGIPGRFGQVFGVFPIVIAVVLLMSFVESFLILPAHLGHRSKGRLWGVTDPVRNRFSAALNTLIQRVYAPMVDLVLRWRGIAVATGVGISAMTAGLVIGGFIPVQFFPEIAGETVTATAILPAGSPASQINDVRLSIEEAVRSAAVSTGADDSIDGLVSATSSARSGEDQVTVELHFASDTLSVSTDDVRAAWQGAVGPLPVGSTLTFRNTMGPSAGEAVNVGLSHSDVAVLERASDDLMETLRGYSSLSNVESALGAGTPSLEIAVNGTGEALGLTTNVLSSQIRAAYQGATALREIDGRNERTITVRLPENERASAAQVLDLPIRLGADEYVSLSDVATVTRSTTPATITREDGRRRVAVTADLAVGVTSASDVLSELESDVIVDLEARYPGLTGSMGGQAEEQSESTTAMVSLASLALFGIFALLAGTFRSYLQPIVVMSAIPFGVVGAALGHVIVGLPLSVISLFGIVALAGVVVNDSLVLVDAANENRRAGMDSTTAVREAGMRRFRPILLTSLTTFLGLAPMILETSVQAQFLIPMAVSLGFGILFATAIVLLLVPVFYVYVEDLRSWMGTDYESEHEDEVSTPVAAK